MGVESALFGSNRRNREGIDARCDGCPNAAQPRSSAVCYDPLLRRRFAETRGTKDFIHPQALCGSTTYSTPKTTDIYKTCRTSQDGTMISTGRTSHRGSPAIMVTRAFSPDATPPGKMAYVLPTNAGINATLECIAPNSERRRGLLTYRTIPASSPA